MKIVFQIVDISDGDAGCFFCTELFSHDIWRKMGSMCEVLSLGAWRLRGWGRLLCVPHLQKKCKIVSYIMKYLLCHIRAPFVRGGADKSLVRPGRKQATATKLGIYSTYSLWSSLQFLARCSNFWKPLKKEIQKIIRPTRSPRQQWPPRRTKNGDLSIVFSVQGTGGSPTGPNPENKVDDQENGSPSRPVSSGLHVPGEPGHCRARRRLPWWPSGFVFTLKCPSVAPAEMSNTRRW